MSPANCLRDLGQVLRAGNEDHHKDEGLQQQEIWVEWQLVYTMVSLALLYSMHMRICIALVHGVILLTIRQSSGMQMIMHSLQN